MTMNFKIVAAFAAALLLGACASSEAPPTDSSASSTTDGGVAGQATPGSVEDFQVNIGDRVFFDYDSYEIRPDSQDTLQQQAAWLQQYGQYAVTIEGHCDERGTREYNLALGERRANAVRNYLVALGVDGSRLQTISYGKERPYVEGHDEVAWAQNRRGVTVLSQ
jgi:peptidoglycan-associated lipoprotein